MNISPYKLLLSPAGRIGRKDFWIGFLLFCALSVLVNLILKRLGSGSTLAFLISLPFPFLVLHMSYAVYGKRLHDMGRSFWPLTWMIVSLILVLMVIMLSFGGSEYFSEFAQYERKAEIDSEVRDAIVERYQTKLAGANTLVRGSLLAIIGGFTLWCGLSKPQAGDNKYGQALT